MPIDDLALTSDYLVLTSDYLVLTDDETVRVVSQFSFLECRCDEAMSVVSQRSVPEYGDAVFMRKVSQS